MEQSTNITVEVTSDSIVPQCEGLVYEVAGWYVTYRITWHDDDRTPRSVAARWWREGTRGPIERTVDEHEGAVTVHSGEYLEIEWYPCSVPDSVTALIMEHVADAWCGGVRR